jgi:hypothetical protein
MSSSVSKNPYRTTITFGAASLILASGAACNGGVNLEPEAPADATAIAAVHDVTEHGVIESTTDPVDASSAPTGTTWLELRARDAVPVYLPGGKTPDLSTYHFGRAGLVEPTKPTRVNVQVAGLDWHQGDSLQLVSPNAGLSIHELEAHFAYPDHGSTAIAAAPFDWMDAHSPLLDASKGDTT